MAAAIRHLLTDLKDPIKGMGLVRKGLKTKEVELFLAQEELPIRDILTRLHIPASTYFSKKKTHQPLDAYASEKFIRLISTIVMASDVMGKEEARNWLYRKIPSLGGELPLNLLDTETGHRLVERALLQIKYGIYG
jgi:putative toxin-antitoxin system antitoxin component (TIGR02293 family)